MDQNHSQPQLDLKLTVPLKLMHNSQFKRIKKKKKTPERHVLKLSTVLRDAEMIEITL